MKNFLRAIVLVPVAILAVLFAVANRQIVTVSFDPFNADLPAFALSAPLFLTILLMVMLGVLIGGTAAWLAQGRVRSELRQARRDADRLRADLQDAKLELDLQRRQPEPNEGGRALSVVQGRTAA